MLLDEDWNVLTSAGLSSRIVVPVARLGKAGSVSFVTGILNTIVALTVGIEPLVPVLSWRETHATLADSRLDGEPITTPRGALLR